MEEKQHSSKDFQFSNDNFIEMAEFFEQYLPSQSKRKLWTKGCENMSSSLIEKDEISNFLYFSIIVYIKAKYENARLPKKSDKNFLNTILKPLETWLLHYKISTKGLTFDEFNRLFPNWLREYYSNHSQWIQESIEWEKKLQDVDDDETRGKICGKSIKLNVFANLSEVKLDINLHHILLVEGYMKKEKLFIPQPLIDLIVFFYAKPLIMKLNYYKEIWYILYCPVNDSWQSMYKKLSKMFRANIVQISYKKQSVFHDNWDDFTWNEQECFEIMSDWTQESIEWERKLSDIAKTIDRTDIATRGKIWDYFDRKRVGKLDCDKSLSRLIYSLFAYHVKVKDRTSRPPRFHLLKPLLTTICQDIKIMMNKDIKKEDNNYITKHDFETHIAVYLKKVARQRRRGVSYGT